MCVKRRNETAATSILFDNSLLVWPIVTIVRNYARILTTSFFDVTKQNLTWLYIIITFTGPNE